MWLIVCASSSIAEDRKCGEEVRELVQAAGLGAADTPGVAVAVLNNGQIRFQCAYGLRDFRTRHKIDVQTNFRLASVTKQFTAMAIMLLAHDGKLRYEDRLTDIFPEFPAYGRAITIRHLLNHTSGLMDYEDLMSSADSHVFFSRGQIQDAGVMALLKQQKRTMFSPGSRWAYSNSGYVLLGLIVEKVAGSAYPEFLRERIFAPLGMTNTVAYVRGRNEVRNRAFGHSREGQGWNETDQSPTSATLGDGGVYSSIEDLAKWDRALNQQRLLSQGEMQAALTPVQVEGVQEPDGSPAAYGFGWFLNGYHGQPRMWHYGESIGFRTTIERFPAVKLTVVVLENRSDPDPARLALRIADLCLSAHQPGPARGGNVC
ncbi:MAG: beta-lactamase family protein [Acidobacteria bacterium]|nr:beta-lactamase family protein [Acidobacteriota bacterium]